MPHSMNQATIAIKGITKSLFEEWIEKEEKPKDFNPPIPKKYKGKGDPMVHFLHFNQIILLERISEALTCKLFATTLIGKYFSWFNQLSEGLIRSFKCFGRKFLGNTIATILNKSQWRTYTLSNDMMSRQDAIWGNSWSWLVKFLI